MAQAAGPGPLIIGSGNGGFPQTASWSMVDLAKLPLQATVGVFSRYAAGRVNPYTVAIGEALCGQFRVTANGRKKLESAISSLSFVGSLGDTLEFGFGIEDVVRSMAKSQQGSICLALCATLKECYHDDVCVEVLLELARLSKVDGQWMPSSLEWKNLLAACAGTLATSAFSRRAEHFMQSRNREQRLGAYGVLERTPKDYRSCSSPKSIAEALSALAQVSRQAMEKVTIVGGSDAGWLGAVAEWLLDLNVTIVDSTGGLFHTNVSESEDTQIQIIYRVAGEQENTIQDIQCIGRTYTLDDVSKLFSEEGRSPNAAVVSGRVNWEKALRSSFLSDFRTMMAIPTTLGELFGSAARIFKAVAQGDRAFPRQYLVACVSYCDQSYGVGLVENILSWFPELKETKRAMEEAVSSNLQVAKTTYERAISNLRNHCGCKACQASSNGFEVTEDRDMTPAPDDGTDPGTEVSSEAIDDWDPDKYCQVIIAETIINLSRSLSNIVLQKDLLPMRSGLEIAYGRQLSSRRSAMSGRQAIVDLGQIAFCMDFDRNFSMGMTDGDDGVEIRLNAVLELFSGQSASLSTPGFSALCVNGVCAFFGILCDASVDANAVARVHVLPGRIQYEGKSYTRLQDLILLRNPEADFSAVKAIASEHEQSYHQTLEIKESSTSLQCILKFNNEERKKYSIGPSALAVLLGSRRGLISCKTSMGLFARPGQGTCRRVKMNPPIDVEIGQTQNAHFVISDKSIDFIRCDTPSVAIAALAVAGTLDTNCTTYIVEHECVHCCVRTALAVDRPERTHFCFLRLPGR